MFLRALMTSWKAKVPGHFLRHTYSSVIISGETSSIIITKPLRYAMIIMVYCTSYGYLFQISHMTKTCVSLCSKIQDIP